MKRHSLLLLLLPALSTAQESTLPASNGWSDDPPAIASLVEFAGRESDLRVAVVRYLEDKAAIERRYPVLYSPARMARLRDFHAGWRQSLAALDFALLNREGQVDYIALRNRVAFDIDMLSLDERRAAEIAPLLPFGDALRLLQEERFDRQRVVPREAATTLDEVADTLDALIAELGEEAEAADGLVRRRGVSPVIANRAASQALHLREILADYNAFYDGYDPLYNFWVREPYARVDERLVTYARLVNEHLAGIREGGKPPIIGDPVLEVGLQAHLRIEMIPYTAADLIRIGEREFDWIEARLIETSNAMDYGDDWKAALEHTKSLAPPPGEKPWAIFDIGAYSEKFFEDMDVVTMPPLAREVWRLDMQTPERQLVNPFFTGGEETRVSYPTDGMAHDDKMMSMRGNTPHFNFATVHHELLPGHHMQAFMSDRFNSHRGALNRTPFWGEGWALYWEFQLWDRDFARNDPDRMGMLFWRLHRAARIIFSLNYQLGRWSPQEAVDFLVERVGHERANAEAEVRRTARDAPLYQIAYMIGALQFRALYDELVTSGRMAEKDYHDAVMLGGRLPVELVRARLIEQPLSPEFRSRWRFYGDP